VDGEHPATVPLGALIVNDGTAGAGVTFIVVVDEQPSASRTVIVLTPTLIPVTE
jgi:hypothetical protein